MNEKLTQFFGFTARFLAVLFVIISILLRIINNIGYNVSISIEIWFGYCFTTLAFFMSYIYSRVENIKQNMDKSESKQFSGLEVFETSEELLSRISEITIGAQKVSTINLSEPPESSTPLYNYFKSINKFLSSQNSTIKIFRRIAYINSLDKLKFILSVSENLHRKGFLSVSLLFNINAEMMPYCYHIVEKDNNIYTFYFPPVSLTGITHSVLIINNEFGKLFTTYYDRLWESLPKLHDGRRYNEAGFIAIEKNFPNIINDKEYFDYKQKHLKE